MNIYSALWIIEKIVRGSGVLMYAVFKVVVNNESEPQTQAGRCEFAQTVKSKISHVDGGM